MSVVIFAKIPNSPQTDPTGRGLLPPQWLYRSKGLETIPGWIIRHEPARGSGYFNDNAFVVQRTPDNHDLRKDATGFAGSHPHKQPGGPPYDPDDFSLQNPKRASVLRFNYTQQTQTYGDSQPGMAPLRETLRLLLVNSDPLTGTTPGSKDPAEEVVPDLENVSFLIQCDVLGRDFVNGGEHGTVFALFAVHHAPFLHHYVMGKSS